MEVLSILTILTTVWIHSLDFITSFASVLPDFRVSYFIDLGIGLFTSSPSHILLVPSHHPHLGLLSSSGHPGKLADFILDVSQEWRPN